MISGFGKKRKITTKKSNEPSNKVMYAVKRTKSGKRVVQVIELKRGRKIVKVYRSTKRAIPKSAEVYHKKSDAKKHLKENSKKLKSGFGASKKTPKYSIPYGYVACVDHSDSYNKQPGKHYKVYKYYPIKLENEYETRKVIIDKQKYTNDIKIYIVPEGAKTYKVRNNGTVADRKKSDENAKAKAKRQAQRYRLGYLAGFDLTPVECDEREISDISNTNAGSILFKGLRNSNYYVNPDNGLATQLTNAETLMAQRRFLGAGANTMQRGIPKFKGFFDKPSKPIYVRGKDRGEARVLGKTKYDKDVSMSLDKGTLRYFRGPNDYSDIDRPRDDEFNFGRKLNYGFSRFF